MSGDSSSVLSAFALVVDPRVSRCRKYPLGDLLLLCLCGLVCGADNYVAICRWARARKVWLDAQLGIGSIPSHDTLGRVMAKLDPAQVAQVLADWSAKVWQAERNNGDVVAFDGKRLKGAADALNVMSAWASRVQLTLALTDGGKGGDEIAALRQLLGLVDVSGCLVTADALHAQVETAQAIVQHKADYLLSLKKNQGELHGAVRHYFGQVRAGQAVFKDLCLHRMKERGVVEERRCWTLEDVLSVDPFQKWPGLRTLVCVERRVFAVGEPETVRSWQRRYFVSSATGTASRFLFATRQHWGIENSQHWRLDVFFREDDCRVRVGHAASNLACLRRLALGLLKRETTEKVGIQTKRQMAGWDTDYLERVLAA